jgi:glycosyltransferase involved in cell wall biosynthesis
MTAIKPSVTFISLDTNLLKPETGNALKRHLEYAKNFSTLNIIVLTTDPNLTSIKFNQDNLHIFGINAISRWQYPANALAIINQINQQHLIDIISTQDPFITALIAIVAKIKYRFHLNIQVHNDYFGPIWRSLSTQNRIFYLLGLVLLRTADSIRVVSPEIKQSIMSFVGKTPVTVIPVLPAAEFISSNPKRQPIPDNIIAIGRLDPQKDFPTLIKAMALVVKSHPQTKLEIIGEGQERNKLLKLIKHNNLSDNITLSGNQTPAQLKVKLSKAALYVSSSLYEGTSIALQEAVVLGTPVVATQVSGTTSLIKQEESGLLVRISNAKQLSQAIIKMLDNPNQAEKMANIAKSNLISKYKNPDSPSWPTYLQSLTK